MDLASIGWRYALLVWGYALAWFLLNSGAKIVAFRMMEYGTKHHIRHLRRVGTPLHEVR